jgi:hypothetical protein
MAFVRRLFAGVAATAAEAVSAAPGDDLVPDPDVVMDRGFDVPGTPTEVWPWLLQLGKGRAGWYLPRTIERLVPPRRRAARSVVPHWQGLKVGERIPDYGGPKEYFEAVEIEPPGASPGESDGHLVYRSARGRMRLSWAITLTQVASGTRVHLRLRLAPVRRVWLAESLGELVDVLTIAGMAAGLRERLTSR